MITTVTPWAATAQNDIDGSDVLYQKKVGGYDFQFYNTGDSIWVTVTWPSAARFAFRLAFGMNSNFDDVEFLDSCQDVVINADTRLAAYAIEVQFPDAGQPIFRYTTKFTVKFPILIPFWPRDILPLTDNGRIENTTGAIHAHQEGGRSGQMFFSMTTPKEATVFYMQNLTAMGEYCDTSKTDVLDSVGGKWPEIGFQFPVNKEQPIPADVEFIISDAFVVLDESVPRDDIQTTCMFLDYLAKVYLLLPRPETVSHDWPEIAEKVAADLLHNKGCWTQTFGVPYLNAYVGDYKTPSEIMVQLAVKLPLQEYLEWKGESHQLFDDLNSGLEHFYDERVKSIVRWHPALEDELDNSEEQKRAMVMDSWYLHHPLMNLARMGLKGKEEDGKLFFDSIDFAIRVAHHFDYEWPVFYKMTTLEVLKAETKPGKGGEFDVAGSYAHVMMLAYKLSGEQKYLNEAKKAVKKLEGLGFGIFYQANNTAFSAGVLLDLYLETNDKKYLQLSYSCLAAIFRNVRLWDCKYGFGKNIPDFFAVFPLNDAPYTAAYEELEVYAALSEYLIRAKDVDLMPALKILIPEFIKYAITRLPYYYPAMLPAAMISADVKTGEIQRDLAVPLEDMQDGWHKSGKVGQEVYGSGLPFAVVPRQYFKTKAGFMIFVDYPVTHVRNGENAFKFTIVGSESLQCSVELMHVPHKVAATLTIESMQYRKYESVESKSKKKFAIPGNTTVRISW
ncbi:MAG: hypothetical protein EOO50_10245 [Flavobacterium sp.]|uniref:hypothetical protein n=1 Tax=Flavobacterium sp. TaxID=239 RepID=UPI0012178E86|nr:hypothetical protein [Flavobacterium sp.]RZJ66303.1 MAG: hypothetical protein EOO50_10245 [Flavobacterium sp.]